MNYELRIKNRSRLTIFLLVVVISSTLLLLAPRSFSEVGFYSTASAEPDCNNPSLGEIDVCLQRIQSEIDALSPAHENNKKELGSLQTQLKDIKVRIAGVAAVLEDVKTEINSREEDLAYQQELLNVRVRSYYIRTRQYTPILTFLFADSASRLAREFAIRQQTAAQDRNVIVSLSQEILSLEEDKGSYEQNLVSLNTLSAQVDSRAKFLEGEVEKVESYITSLSARQQELIALKEAGFQTSVGATPETFEPCTGPPGSTNFCDPGFKPAFAAFSFGAPHRTGMSQYGAYGRAKSGQSAEEILSAYYQGASLRKDYPVPGSITVDGYGQVPFEDNYLLGIYEVPESWGDNGGFEALKAQAVAARSYALYATGGGSGSICPTESCQVYKPQLKSGKWKEAVQATRGWVLEKGGSPAAAYYASTSGGFTVSQWGWSGIKDTAGAWPDQAYEKVSGSPWFYKAWYKTRSGNSCGKSNPWLTSSEMADILNAWHVIYKGGGDVSRVSPVTTSCWSGNPYSVSELASIGGHTSVSSVSVVYSNEGYTANLSFSTNKGSVSISGAELKKAFNLRAPGYIGIKSSLFNIEKL